MTNKTNDHQDKDNEAEMQSQSSRSIDTLEEGQEGEQESEEEDDLVEEEVLDDIELQKIEEDPTSRTTLSEEEEHEEQNGKMVPVASSSTGIPLAVAVGVASPPRVDKASPTATTPSTTATTTTESIPFPRQVQLWTLQMFHALDMFVTTSNAGINLAKALGFLIWLWVLLLAPTVNTDDN